ncbi:MAG TPA: nickel pincer cofactor biosynthesis protein LarB [Myxococcota bacterium]|nr:nickel pincer cofactor biosynthesis protein LarB [Myxococcota bacterium]
MTPEDIRVLLDQVASGRMTPADALLELRDLPARRLGDVAWDSHRILRRGIAESIYGSTKTPRQIADALLSSSAAGTNCVVTRIKPEPATDAIELFVADGGKGELVHHEPGSILSLLVDASRPISDGFVAVVTAGTSDIPVAEEAAVTLETCGNRVVRIRDVGVAGIHRLGIHIRTLQEASAVIVAAGMEGALPGIVAGLTSAPVIGIPTSVGYGTSFGGITALLAMLNSCAGGLTVVNIDNGYGAAVAAHLINARTGRAGGAK